MVADIVAWLTGLPCRAVVLAEDETHLNLLPHARASWTLRTARPQVPTPGSNQQVTVFGAIEVTAGAWVYRPGRRCAADFIALLDQLLRAFPCAPVIAVICDVTANAGWVNAGTGHDTAAFAVESIRRWWNADGSQDYPAARRLLITADAGGSSGYRARAWKAGLAALAEQTGLEITCCHFPPGTSKWNKAEHRLFSRITMNWRGRPLTSHDVIIDSIAATAARTGLTVQARLDDGT